MQLKPSRCLISAADRWTKISTTKSLMLSRLALIVYDYDDTLFPRTFMIQKGYTTQPLAQLPQNVRNELRSLEQSAIRLLRKSQRHGTVKIVSNGSINWINRSCTTYMPQMWSYIQLSNINIISAYDERRSQDGENTIAWKRHIFGRIMWQQIVDIGPLSRFLKFVSVGDGRSERQAASQMKSYIPNSRIRLVVFNPKPTITQLDDRLRQMEDHVRRTVWSFRHVDIRI